MSNNSFNLQCNNVVQQVEQKCCPYYLVFSLEILGQDLNTEKTRPINNFILKASSLHWAIPIK